MRAVPLVSARTPRVASAKIEPARDSAAPSLSLLSYPSIRVLTTMATTATATATDSAKIVKPALKHILKDTPFKEGTWSFRLASLFCVSPVYAAVLWAVGTAVGRNAYFAPMSAKIANRFNVLGMVRRIGARRPAYEEDQQVDLKKVRGGRWAVGGGRWRWAVEGGRWAVEGARWAVPGGGRCAADGGRYRWEMCRVWVLVSSSSSSSRCFSHL